MRECIPNQSHAGRALLNDTLDATTKMKEYFDTKFRQA